MTPIDDVGCLPSPYEAIIKNAALFVGRHGHPQLSLESTAKHVKVDQKTATDLFGDTEGLTAKLDQYLNSQCWAFLNEPLSQLAANASPQEHYNALALGFYNFSKESQRTYAAYIAIEAASEAVLPFSTEAINSAPNFRPMWTLCMNITRDAFRATGADLDEERMGLQAFSFYTAIHGIVHLCTYGVARDISSAAKRNLVATVVDNMYRASVGMHRPAGTATFEPAAFAQPLNLKPAPTAARLPKETAEDKRTALYRGAIECFMLGGNEFITLHAAAARARVPLAEAATLIDGDAALLHNLETYCENAAARAFREQVDGLGTVAEYTPIIGIIKACMLGYFAYAATDPDQFITHVNIASGAGGPQSLEETHFDPSGRDAYALFINTVRRMITDGGGDYSPWSL